MNIKELTDEEINKAYILWIIKSRRRRVDDQVHPFLSEQVVPWVPNQNSWLMSVRMALFLSATALARRLNVSAATYVNYERCEKQGTITLETLSRVAEAMDCELVYAIRPKSRRFYSEIVWEKLLETAQHHPWIRKCDQRKRSMALLYIVEKLVRDTEFRKSQGWSQRKNF